MKKLFTLLVFSSLLFSQLLVAQGTESFTNLTASGSSYGSGSYTGDNGDTWTYNGARRATATYNITGVSIGFGSSGTRNVSSNSGANGVGDVSFSIRSYFTGGNASNRTMEVFVNGMSRGSFTLAAMGVVEMHTITDINEEGNVSIQFVSTGTRQIILDDVSWTAFAGPTPVTLRSFDANLKGQNVQLNWTTDSEEQNDYFAVEYSTDGSNFEEIDWVKGAGTSFATNDYEYLHESPVKGNNYYRLAQVDYNGKTTYSSVEVVQNEKISVKVFPTIATDEITVAFEETSNNTIIEIYDLMGRQMLSSIIDGDDTNWTLPVDALQAGHYLVRINAANQIHTARFIKQ